MRQAMYLGHFHLFNRILFLLVSGIEGRPKRNHKSLSVELWLRLFTFPIQVMPPSGSFLLRCLTKNCGNSKCRRECMDASSVQAVHRGLPRATASLVHKCYSQLALVLLPCGKMTDLGNRPMPPCASFELDPTLLNSLFIH